MKLLKEFLKFCHTFFWVFPYCKSNIFVQNGITIFIKSWKNVFNKATFREILVPSLSNVNNYVVCIYWKYANISRNNAAELTTSILSFWVLASSATLFMHFFLHKYGPQINFFCPMMGEVSQHSFIKHIFIWFEKTFYTMKTEQTNQKNFTEIFMLTQARLCWNSWKNAISRWMTKSKYEEYFWGAKYLCMCLVCLLVYVFSRIISCFVSKNLPISVN